MHKDIADIMGVATKLAERAVDRFLDGVDSNLHIHCPIDDVDLKRCANKWNEILSAQGLYYCVIEQIDGWLCCTDRPSVCNAVRNNL